MQCVWRFIWHHDFYFTCCVVYVGWNHCSVRFVTFRLCVSWHIRGVGIKSQAPLSLSIFDSIFEIPLAKSGVFVPLTSCSETLKLSWANFFVCDTNGIFRQACPYDLHSEIIHQPSISMNRNSNGYINLEVDLDWENWTVPARSILYQWSEMRWYILPSLAPWIIDYICLKFGWDPVSPG